MPSFNEHTGARISSGSHVKGTDKEKFDNGWDAIFGKKEVAVREAKPECESCCGSGWVETWGPEGEGSGDCGECKVSIND